MSEAPIPVCKRFRLASFKAMAAVSISITIARLSPHITDSFTFFEISETELKSPGLDTGNPASITSTPRLSKSLAISTFS